LDGPVFERPDSRHGEDPAIAISLMENIEIVAWLTVAVYSVVSK
jgi:hypothetical protein